MATKPSAAAVCRLRNVGAHLRHEGEASRPARPCTVATAGGASSQPKVLLTDDEVKAFLINGWHILPGPHIGLPDSLHD
eukprot:SAG31_NODE_8785_length_1387_cov_2.284161_2_plen_78_part_01